jgi:hypothetical protein
MYRTDAQLRRDCADHRSAVLSAVRDYGPLVPAKLVADERRAASLARHALLRDGGAVAPAEPGIARRWLGRGVVRLGERLGGTAVPRAGVPHAEPA